MERIKNLGCYQKTLLVLMIFMVLAFTVLYCLTVSREGFAYKDVILIPHRENENILYTGEIQGNQAIFTVSADKTVAFQYGDKLYGPYTAKEDATAIPEDGNMASGMTGVELRCGDEVIFRGGVWKSEDFWWLVNEDGSSANMVDIFTTGNGITTDENGNILDPMEPSVSTVLHLMDGPELTHKGQWLVWFCGVFICIVTTILILFADELFRFALAFKIHNIDHVEPSDWEVTSRYITWTVLPALALVIFVLGLQ